MGGGIFWLKEQKCGNITSKNVNVSKVEEQRDLGLQTDRSFTVVPQV